MKKTSLLLAACSAFLPCVTYAHTGADAGMHHGWAFLQGFAHPFTGIDHLAAMLLVGIWSVQAFMQQRRAMWCVPMAFAALLLCGGILGMVGVAFSVEAMIALSLLVFGVLVTYRIRLPLPLGVVLAGGFAVFHGMAHGAELPVSSASSALLGMVAGTLLLHLAGMLLAHFVLNRHHRLAQVIGWGTVALGFGLFVA